MSNPLRTQYTIRREAKLKLKWCAAMTPSKVGGIKNGHSGHTIHSTKTNKYTQYTVRRQTNIHNTQYDDKQTYTIYSTKTNKHTQYTVRRQTNIHNTQYEDKQTYKEQHRTLNIWATLKVTKPSGIKNVNPSGTNQTVRRQTSINTQHKTEN